MRRHAVAPLVLILALSSCTSVAVPNAADTAATSLSTPTPTPAVSRETARPTPAVDVPIVDSAVRATRVAVPPQRVQIADAGVDMEVVPVGVEEGGFMQLPPNPAVGGWYQYGSDPWSADGNTVIAAHIDAPDYPIGPFDVLRDLAPETEVDVLAGNGEVARYAIVSVTYYPKQELPTEAIFAREGSRSLVLITCGGDFDSTTGHYADNVVAIATPLSS